MFLYITLLSGSCPWIAKVPCETIRPFILAGGAAGRGAGKSTNLVPLTGVTRRLPPSRSVTLYAPPSFAVAAGSPFTHVRPSPFVPSLLSLFTSPPHLSVALAVFFAILGHPLQRRLQRWVGGGLALVLTVVGIGASLIALPLISASNLQVVIARLPDYPTPQPAPTSSRQGQLSGNRGQPVSRNNS